MMITNRMESQLKSAGASASGAGDGDGRQFIHIRTFFTHSHGTFCQLCPNQTSNTDCGSVSRTHRRRPRHCLVHGAFIY